MSREKGFLPPRYMSIANAVQQLLYVEENIRKGGAYNRSTMCVGLARVGRRGSACDCRCYGRAGNR